MACFIQQFVKTVESYPDSSAITFGGVTVDYITLYNMSQRVKNSICGLVDRNEVVIILMERSIEMIAVMLGIIRTGAAFQLIDLKTPINRINTIISESGANLIVGRENLNLIECDRRFVEYKDLVNNEVRSLKEDVYANPTDIAYVIFTSGSTGKPKGVMVQHQGMMNHFASKLALCELKHGSKIAQTASQSFDIFVWQSLAALTVGGHIHIYPDAVVLNANKLVVALINDGVNIVQMVPSYLDIFLLAISLKRPMIEKLRALRYIFTTGEKLNPSTVYKLVDLKMGAELINGYGPAELSDNVCHYVVPFDESVQHVPIGYPISETIIYIVNESGGLCENNETGEIWVAGSCVGAGYVNIFSNEKFIDNPFYDGHDQKYTRVYKTGDLGRKNAQGQYEFAGRIDNQIKINGHRIEIEEIEEILLKNDVFINVCLVFTPESADRLSLVYSSREKVDEEALFCRLTESLPKYMIPTRFIEVDNIPRLTNGKINRMRIKDIVIGGASGGVKHEFTYK
jgi:amino acid adenylation domain-containing protein